MNETLTDENYLIYCAKVYDNPHCISTDEFIEDLNRVTYIKKLITRYIEKGDLRERLILNHIMIIHNLFGAEATVRMLYLKLKTHFHCIKPFLVLLNILPDKILNVGDDKVINTDIISMDTNIVNKLREIKNG